MNLDTLLVQKKGRVAIIVLNRPQKKNSLSPALLIELSRVIQDLKEDSETRALIIRGSGDTAFSSGFDINSLPTSGTSENHYKIQIAFDTALRDISTFPYPVIAMLNGYAYGGGCELAVSCDLRVGAEGISMGIPSAKLGLVYPADGLKRFVQLLGFAKTKELFYTGRYYSAKRALDIGLIDYLISKDELEDYTLRLAEEIADNSPLAIKGTKQILGMLSDSFHLNECEMEKAELIVKESLFSEDLKESKAAFLERRKPVFKNR